MSQKDIFKDQAQIMKQNLILSMFSDGMSDEDKIKIACDAGVSSPAEMASLLNLEKPTEWMVEKMTSNLLFQGETVPNSLRKVAEKLLRWP